MKILFLHNNFPAQFGAFGQYLSRLGWEVVFMTQRAGARSNGIQTVVYRDREQPGEQQPHPLLRSADRAVVTGASALEVGQVLVDSGFSPDVIMAHSGWGPGLFLKDLWPDAVYIPYVEWYYHADAPDLRHVRGRAPTPAEAARERARSWPILSDLAAADAVLTPTRFQAEQIPPDFHQKVEVMHDGIDAESFSPGAAPAMEIGGLRIEPGDKVLTSVARGMEPYRGFPETIRAVAELQRRHPDLKTVILGEDRVAYGPQLPEGDSWKRRMLSEVQLDMSRVAFPGLVPRPVYRDLLRHSSLHLYLTVPFVLSWSMMEAMSTGCLLVASRTAPVNELVEDGVNGLLCELGDQGDIVAKADRALQQGSKLAHLRIAARRRIVEGYAQDDIFRAKTLLLRRLVERTRGPVAGSGQRIRLAAGAQP